MSQYLKYRVGDVVGDVHYARFRLRPRARHLSSPVTSPTWYIVATNPRGEEKAKDGLEKLGYRVFLPMETVWVRVPPHRQKAKGCKKEKIDRPLFRGYLFMGLDKGVHPFEPARLTDGVVDIIRNHGEYMPVPNGIIEPMMEAVAHGDHDQTAKEAEKLLNLIGRTVTLREGPLAGFVAVVRKATEKLVDVETEAFGKKIKLRMVIEDVEPL